MGEAVEQGACQPLGAEHRCPLVERQIASDHCGAAFVSLREHFEQQLGTGW